MLQSGGLYENFDLIANFTSKESFKMSTLQDLALDEKDYVELLRKLISVSVRLSTSFVKFSSLPSLYSSH